MSTLHQYDFEPDDDGDAPEALNIIAKPFAWPDPATIPPRQFLFGRHYVRKAIGATVGGGGRAKTTLSLLEAVSMACGRDLLTGEQITPLRVWHVNGEEDQDELDRRITAICQRYGVTEAQCGGRVSVQSVRDNPIRFATMGGNTPRLNRIALDQFEEEIRTKQIDVFMIDPLVSFHSIPENDNGSMDLLLKEGLGGIASRTNGAGEVFHVSQVHQLSSSWVATPPARRGERDRPAAHPGGGAGRQAAGSACRYRVHALGLGGRRLPEPGAAVAGGAAIGRRSEHHHRRARARAARLRLARPYLRGLRDGQFHVVRRQRRHRRPGADPSLARAADRPVHPRGRLERRPAGRGARRRGALGHRVLRQLASTGLHRSRPDLSPELRRRRRWSSSAS